MVQVTILNSGVTKSFTNNRKGNAESVKYIQSLYDGYKKNIVNYRSAEILKLRKKLQVCPAREEIAIEKQIKEIEKDRLDTFNFLGIEPETLKIEICTL